MDYLPLHFDLRQQTVLVVGGGEVAFRKVELLLQANARIRLVAPDISNRLRQLLDKQEVIESEYEPGHLNDVALVIAATSDINVNTAVSTDARKRFVPVNVVDQPGLCTVIFPAIVDRSPVLISVSTGGGSPVLSRYIKTLLEIHIPAGIGRLATYLKGKRDWLKQKFPDTRDRRQAVEAFLASPGNTLAMGNDSSQADPYFESGSESKGEVYLVGAGPGDPDLLTLRAVRLLQAADVILYDNLVSDAVLQRARRDAYKEFVGKRSGYQSTTQENINELMVRLAREGKRVLRLKGGDPFIFGRGGEEIETLIAEKIPFQVVPGITAASGCAAYAGIPLTHRDYSQSVRFVTGHPKDGSVNLSWDEMVTPNQTIVFYMGLGGLASICQQLIQHGMPAEMPVAVISKGTTPEQKVVRGNLETIPGLAARMQLESPTLIIVGNVVRMSQAGLS